MKVFFGIMVAAAFTLGACSRHLTEASTGTDLLERINRRGCDDVDGTPHAGATNYFHGVLAQDSAGWSGTETWLIFANSTWEEQGQTDCQVVWDLRVSEVDPSNCPTCDIGLSIHATVDPARSDCPLDLYAGSEVFEVGYEVARSSEGTAHWFFADSGTPLGTGGHRSGSMNYLSEHQCLWF